LPSAIGATARDLQPGLTRVLLKTLPVHRAGKELVLLAERPGTRQKPVMGASTSSTRWGQSEATDRSVRLPAANRFSTSHAPMRRELASGQLVSGNCFDLLGLHAAGRAGLLNGERRGADSNAQPVAVISDGFLARVTSRRTPMLPAGH